MRVVSVLPSATEIVFALGHGDELVGRSAECDYPPEAGSLPVVMRPRTSDADRTSREIDERVQRVRGEGQSLYELDIDLLRKLQPDLLLTQDLCGVCSVTEAEVATACATADVAPLIVSLTPRTLSNVWENVETVARALDDPARGRELSRRLRDRTAAPRVRGPRPRVAIVEWLDPPILAGLWAPDIVRAAGGSILGGRRGKPGIRSDWSTVSDAHPDLVVLSPCSFSVERSRRELERESLSRAIAQVRAPRGVFIADEAYFSRPGPRLADGVDLVRHLLSDSPWQPPLPVELLVERTVGAAT
ncbi:MAG: ABC transporter substrate-binding protein [Thermoplasmata archaeon]